MINQYIEKIKDLLVTVEKEESQTMNRAAEKVAESIQSGGIIRLFGCGHSHILAEEVYYRAGGLVPVQPISHEPLMLHKNASQLALIERENDYAKEFMESQDIQKGDVVFVISTSGRNPVPVDVALIAKGKGAYIIGITSIKYSISQPSRHISGIHLYEAVDLVIDNHSPIGDALLAHEKVAVPYSPSSTVIGSTILNAIFAESVSIMAENNFAPPVFLSGNIEGADEHNKQLIEKYSERIKL